MKQYQVNITAKALADMGSIYEFIAVYLQSPETAMAQYLRIADGIESFCTFPERRKTFESQPERRLGLRQLRVNYSHTRSCAGCPGEILQTQNT